MFFHYGCKVGITPAYTGKSSSNFCLAFPGKDHPRIHGEKQKYVLLEYTNTGSPPHTRGKVSDRKGNSYQSRITPAYTGKRMVGMYFRPFSGDHPRIHGEKFFRWRNQHPKKGSPPHTRGKVKFLCVFLKVLRITPAYTGKSGFSVVNYRTGRDHPRIHGEKFITTGKMLANIRITPAYTGKSSIKPLLHPRQKDHPRIHGEKLMKEL